MAVISIPDTAEEQPTQSENMSESGARGFSRTFKDEYDTLKDLAADISTDDTLDGKTVISFSLNRCPGDYGLLTLNLTESDTNTGLTAQAQKAVWTCKSVRNDMSILAYCGAAASRINLELWLKETDAGLASAYKFHKSDYEEDMLNSQEQAIAEKLQKGIESVIRFFPILTCTSYWSSIPPKFFEDLGIATEPETRAAKIVHAPGNLSQIIHDYSWLKVQDDVSETGDGRWQRVESWMGVSADDGGWDGDLYGDDDRWPMPLE